MENLIDDLVVRDDDRDYFMLTSSHPDESIDDAMRFARSLTGEYEGEVQLVELKREGAWARGGTRAVPDWHAEALKLLTEKGTR